MPAARSAGGRVRSRRRTVRAPALTAPALDALFASAAALRRTRRSRPGLVDLGEYRSARIAAGAARVLLDEERWVARVSIGWGRPAGLVVRVETIGELPRAAAMRVPAFVHGVPVRLEPPRTAR